MSDERFYAPGSHLSRVLCILVDDWEPKIEVATSIASPSPPPSSGISPFPNTLCGLLLKHNVLIEADPIPSLTAR